MITNKELRDALYELKRVRWILAAQNKRELEQCLSSPLSVLEKMDGEGLVSSDLQP